MAFRDHDIVSNRDHDIVSNRDHDIVYIKEHDIVYYKHCDVSAHMFVPPYIPSLDRSLSLLASGTEEGGVWCVKLSSMAQFVTPVQTSSRYAVGLTEFLHHNFLSSISAWYTSFLFS